MEESRRDGDFVRIETPEHVVFEYELAGIGSRVIAAAIDLMLTGFIMLGLLLVVVLVAGGFDVLGPWAAAAAAVAAFLTFWGYPIFFEIYMRGQTPGKRSLGMRVVQEGGYALTPAVVVVRNLLRVADFLPGGYFLGLAVMVCNRRYKRIGDFVAGTIVIRDRAAGPVSLPRRELGPVFHEEAAEALRLAGAHRVPPEQLRLAEDFLARRLGLDPAARRRLADALARPIREQLGVPPMPSEKFLQALVLACRKNEEEASGGRGAGGPP